MSFNQGSSYPKLLFIQTVILRLSDDRLKPEFGFPIRALHVDERWPRFFGHGYKVVFDRALP
jgi:hypothetical protein